MKTAQLCHSEHYQRQNRQFEPETALSDRKVQKHKSGPKNLLKCVFSEKKSQRDLDVGQTT